MAKKRNRITADMSKTIADSSPLIKKTTITTLPADTNNVIHEINLRLLNTNPYQPRMDINIQSLNELISSIEQNGLLQPIVITEIKDDGTYTIIAGHRRFEAFKIMGKEKISAIIIKDIKDKDLAILSLTENLMRENLHPIENAIAMKNILDHGLVLSQNKLAEYLGLSKGYISKLMNILKLPTAIITLVKKENYKDINVLVLLNKLKDETIMLDAYQTIKNLTRAEAEKHLKNLLNPSIKTTNSITELQQTKNKINLSINIKDLSIEIQADIQERIKLFYKDLNIYLNNGN